MTPRVLQVEQFPEDLRRQLKARAANRGTTLRQEVIAACQALLAAEKPPPVPAPDPRQLSLPL
jgi:plasmid stability protein